MVYTTSILHNDLDGYVGDVRMSYGWYPENSTLCPRCYGVMNHVYKDDERSIYMCPKCGKETSVKLEEKEQI